MAVNAPQLSAARLRLSPAALRLARLDPAGLRRPPALRRSPAAEWPLRALDRAVCLLAGLPALAVVAACACAIRLDSPGPALFSQPRTGRGGQRFRLWKLRTMVADAESLKPALRARSEVDWPDFKLSHDPRITRVGAWLRRTSLDELPQLWNVWRGEMSLVGPRPTSFAAATYEPWQAERLEVLPGLTGLWQVLARGRCSFAQRSRLDIIYVRSRSLGLNLRILAATALSVLRDEGAK
ncbi:MAG: sugar transferase [Terriglobales bacterium]